MASPNEFDLAPPSAASLIESLRAFSYELPTAIADLVDNSITAGAKSIWVDFHWDGPHSLIAVTDDGSGMSEDVLVKAMRPGSKSPLEPRSPEDLGRFGLGLKTASFSQCRELTVMTKTETGAPSIRRWNLDHVSACDSWQLLRTPSASSAAGFARLAPLKHGTAVVWTSLDRLTEGTDTNNDSDQQAFLERLDEVREHLGIIYHRKLGASNRLSLYVNGQKVNAWDPFLERHDATQTTTESVLPGVGWRVAVKPFVLPHHSKLTPDEHAKAGGSRGWNAHQGFYVYRNERLLVAGSWLNLGWAKEEHYKLARIRVDIDNDADALWNIDVTKSRALPPHIIKGELKAIAAKTRQMAKRVYSFRGARLAAQLGVERVFLWHQVAHHGKVHYRIDRSHPLVKATLSTLGNSKAFRSLLTLIEETVPIPMIAVQHAEQPQSIAGPFTGPSGTKLREVVVQTMAGLVDMGHTLPQARDYMSTMWPFTEHMDVVLAVYEDMEEAH